MSLFRKVMGVSLALLTFAAAGVMFTAPAGAADTTHWLCKPGQADNPCIGDLSGKSLQSDGTSTDFDYQVNPKAPIDCFYVYPTQSNQTTPNANLNPDKELKDVAINQAQQFSRTCKVYAPLYRQYTFHGPITDQVRDTAYAGVLQGWKDYLKYYNHGRGVVLIGHSQGSSHLGRLIQEEIDPNRAERSKLISAIIPGANVFVPKGKLVGGEFQNIPACQTATELGCVIAYSSYLNEPPVGSSFGRIASGYWINPMPRPDPAKYEVMCVNPAALTGGNLDALANLGVFLGGASGARPWTAEPGYYSARCMNQDDAVWLNITPAGPPDPRPDLTAFIADDDGNLHLGDINLAEENLIRIVATETGAYLARTSAQKKLGKAKKRLRKARKHLKRSKRFCRKAKMARRKAAKHGNRKVRRHAAHRARKKCHSVRRKARKVKRLRHQVKKYRRLSRA